MSGSSRFFTEFRLSLSPDAGCCAGAEEGNQNRVLHRGMNGERWQTDLDEFQQRAHQLGGSVLTAPPMATTICSFAKSRTAQEAASMFSCFCATIRVKLGVRGSRAPETCSSNQL